MNNVNFQDLNRQDLDKKNSQDYAAGFKKGLNPDVIRAISKDKSEPQWLLDIRIKAFSEFQKMEMPQWGPDISDLDIQNIRFFAKANDAGHKKTWDDVPDEIKQTFEKLKIPKAERALLAGVGAQYESENVYHKLKKEWEDLGVLFEDFDIAVQKYPDIVKKYFTRCVPIRDHKFAALHYAVFSGGTFLYVPKNTKISQPLQAYFRMNAINQGQFEHTLIIIEEGSDAHYIEGCSAPKYGSQSLHAGCVEIFVHEHAKMQYSSVENWSSDTYNLNTKRAIVQKNSTMEWIGGNLGSGLTMLYPCSILNGDNARCEHLGIAFAGKNQNQDTGAKVIINGKNCKSSVVSKSIAKDGGTTTYRGLVRINPSADNATINVECDALMMDDCSLSDTIPKIQCDNKTATITHEASAGKISPETLLYCQSRGISEEKAKGMIVNGFFNDIVKALPLEYAVELNRLMELEMENSIG